MVGLSTDDITSRARWRLQTPKTDAILKLARSIVVNRGELTDPDLAQPRATPASATARSSRPSRTSR
jgi:hypothetical protein